MPSNYEKLIPQTLLEEYCYQISKNTNALFIQESKAMDALYRLVAREMAQKDPPLIISYVEITVSPQCTLHCVDCANLMPLYKKPKSMSIADCKNWTIRFLEAVDYVLMFRVMGGEPLMQKEFVPFIEFLKLQDKIQHIQIVTNGTLLMNEKQIQCLQNKKCSLYVSHYPKEVAPRYEEILEQCSAHSISAFTTEKEFPWQDMGGFHKRNENPALLKNVYDTCNMECRHIWNGEFHVCPRSAHGMALGVIPRDNSCYVDLLNTDTAMRRNQIRALYDVPYVNACAYCNSIYERSTIAAARQIVRHAK